LELETKPHGKPEPEPKQNLFLINEQFVQGKKQKFKAPKIQRLVTPVMLQRKRHR
jgi:hypothetical protein